MCGVNQKLRQKENGKTLMIQVHVDLLGLILEPRPAENLLTGEHWLQQHIQTSTKNTHLFPPRMCTNLLALKTITMPFLNFRIIGSQITSKVFIQKLYEWYLQI